MKQNREELEDLTTALEEIRMRRMMNEFDYDYGFDNAAEIRKKAFGAVYFRESVEELWRSMTGETMQRSA